MAAHPFYSSIMLNTELSRTVLELPTADRLELARRLVESIVEPAPLNAAAKEGIRRIEDVATGRVAGMTEEQYRAAVR
jgi:putative addiction module component (TIGR02574 family)